MKDKLISMQKNILIYIKTYEKTILIIAINIVISVLTHFLKGVFWLNENQILYIFATIAQVTGGVFGLTLAAYTLIDDKLKRIGEREETSADFVNQIRNDNFEKLKEISVLSIGSILLAIFVLAVYRNKCMEIKIFFMLEAVCFFVQMLVKIYRFILAANPESIEIKKEQQKELFDSEYKTTDNIEAKSFGAFIAQYNILEKSIILLAQKQLQQGDNDSRLRIMDALDILRDNEIITQKCFAWINELRLYRNSLVHSVNNTNNINSTLYEILEKISNLFVAIINAPEKETAKKELNEYMESLSITVDENVLKFIGKHSQITIKDVTQGLNITREKATREIQKLVMCGYVEKEIQGKRVVYRVRGELRGTFAFDYSNNNGKYIIGNNEWKFETMWSKGSDRVIHAYSDPKGIESIARAKKISDFTIVTEEFLAAQDYSSRCRDIEIGDTVIWKNENGHYLLTLVEKISDDTRGQERDWLEGKYQIIL